MISQHFVMFTMRMATRYKMTLISRNWCKNHILRNRSDRTEQYYFATSPNRNISIMCSMCKQSAGIPRHHSDNSIADKLLSTAGLYKRSLSGQKSDEAVIAEQSINPNNAAIEVSDSIIAVCSKTDKMILSVPPKKVEELVNFLFSEGFQREQVQQFLVEKPEFLTSSHKLRKVLLVMKAHQFQVEQILQVINALPDLSFLGASHVGDLFTSMATIGVDGDRLCQLVTSVPALLSLEGNHVVGRAAELKAFFTKADVTRLVLQTPAVLLCDWADILEKFAYVHNVMNVSQRQIVYSNLFTYPLFHVKCRHMFLVRAGFFLGDKKARDRNPMLQDIIDSSDFEFSKKYGDMQVDDFRTFCKLLAKNIEDEEFENEDD